MNSQIPDIEKLEAYLDGKLSAKDMYLVEREALDDPFVFEALEGLDNSPRRSEMLSLLQLQMRRRVEMASVNKRRWNIQTHRMSIAAAAALMFITAGVMYWMKSTSFVEERKSPVEVALTPIDQIKEEEQIAASSSAMSTQSDAVINNNPDALREAGPGAVSLAKSKVSANKALLPNVSEEVVSMNTTAAAPTAMSAARIALVKDAYVGRVVDADTNLPIEGASLINQDDKSTYLTSNNGAFRIQVLEKNKKGIFSVSAKGYISQEINLNTFEEAKISLKKEI